MYGAASRVRDMEAQKWNVFFIRGLNCPHLILPANVFARLRI